MFQRILIANRGEIALRVIRACKDLGIQSVAVFSEADRDAPYLKFADDAICIGPGKSAESYLNIPRIIAAAEIADVQAIHPGYGFLSENPDFAEVCRSCRIEFIGPAHESMRLLGNKAAARELAIANNVPIVPGSPGPVETEKEAFRIAHEIGFPVLIKAAAGGGGRGMRVARNDMSFHNALQQAKSEAEAAFRDGSVYIEKLVEKPRHIEVQIFADHHGNTVHLWERDCSLQRRYQKLVEESPAPGLPASVREEICKSAVRLAKAANYVNAGTCEFLVDSEFNFYFIEANTRIQVEHPVTELVTGIDLVKEQIRVAAGEPLSFTQQQVQQRGCAIECRINAEDPDHDFRPSPGLIEHWIVPGGFGVRVDTHACAGYRVPPNYDSLVAKLLVYQPTRAEAVACVKRALDEFVVKGIHTTIPLHRRLFRDSA
ncbi:MAG: acetyl-CoA carboxylase biotin carboxylase subunit, partial [Planctomycetota bacterium]